jgi:NUMOD4 motif/HNH endonuclease
MSIFAPSATRIFPQAVLLLEHWKPVVGYEGWYEISNMGRVRRVGRTSRAQFGKILKPKVTVYGYLTVCLSVRQCKHEKFVHVLVAEAFISPKPAEMTVNHIDTNKQNPRVSNLEYLTQLDNNVHAQLAGLYHRGEQINTAILTEPQVRDIKALKGKVHYRDVAATYNVHKDTIWKIFKGKNWRHVV